MLTMPFSPLVAGVLLTGLGGPRAIGPLPVLTGLVALIPTLSRAVRGVPRPATWQAALRSSAEVVVPATV
jgi:hypothetical protein